MASPLRIAVVADARARSAGGARLKVWQGRRPLRSPPLCLRPGRAGVTASAVVRRAEPGSVWLPGAVWNSRRCMVGGRRGPLRRMRRWVEVRGWWVARWTDERVPLPGW